MAIEARVDHLRRDLQRFGYIDALKALELMISIMNRENGFERNDGSHYYYHLVDGCQDLINHGIRDEITLTSYILHDSIEDIDYVDYTFVKDMFGDEVAEVVEGVTKKDGVDYDNSLYKIAYLRDMIPSFRKCLVKTADRKHNFSTLDSVTPEKEIRQARDTEMYFLPFFKYARREHPEYSAYFHSAKTTIVPHLKRIIKSHETERELRARIEQLENGEI